MPWDEVSIAGAAAVSGLISLAKRLGLPNHLIRPVTWAIGFVWLVLARVAVGEDWVKAITGSIIVVLGAPGFYELVSKPVGKSLSH